MFWPCLIAKGTIFVGSLHTDKENSMMNRDVNVCITLAKNNLLTISFNEKKAENEREKNEREKKATGAQAKITQFFGAKNNN